MRREALNKYVLDTVSVTLTDGRKCVGKLEHESIVDDYYNVGYVSFSHLEVEKVRLITKHRPKQLNILKKLKNKRGKRGK